MASFDPNDAKHFKKIELPTSTGQAYKNGKTAASLLILAELAQSVAQTAFSFEARARAETIIAQVKKNGDWPL